MAPLKTFVISMLPLGLWLTNLIEIKNQKGSTHCLLQDRACQAFLVHMETLGSKTTHSNIKKFSLQGEDSGRIHMKVFVHLHVPISFSSPSPEPSVMNFTRVVVTVVQPELCVFLRVCTTDIKVGKGTIQKKPTQIICAYEGAKVTDQARLGAV